MTWRIRYIVICGSVFTFAPMLAQIIYVEVTG